MSTIEAPPISPASLSAYFTGLVSFLLGDLRSALESLPSYHSIKQSTKTPPEIYDILRQPTATWTELRKALQVDRILLGSLTQSCHLKDGVIGVNVFSVKGGDGWLGMACTSGGWQLVEILAYLGRLRDRVELAVAEAAAHPAANPPRPVISAPSRKPKLARTLVPPPPPLPQCSPPQVPAPQPPSTPSETQDQPKFSLPDPYEVRKTISSASTSKNDLQTPNDPPTQAPTEQNSRSKTSAKVRARVEDTEEPIVKKKRRGRPKKLPVPPPKFDEIAPDPSASSSSSHYLVLDTSTSSNLGKVTESTETKTSIPEEASAIATFAPPPPAPLSALALRSRSPSVDTSTLSPTFSPPKPAAHRIPSPSSHPSPPSATITSTQVQPDPSQPDLLSPAISPIAKFASPRPKLPRPSKPSSSSSRRRLSVDPLKGEVYVPSSRESTTGRVPKRERKLPERIKRECGMVDEDGNEIFESEDEGKRMMKTFGEIEEGEDSELSTDGSLSSASTANSISKAKGRKRWSVGETAFVRFPNYSWWIATILDPSTAPAETQGRQIRGSYLVKSIPTGADHRWMSPDENSIRPIEDEELAQIETGDYPAEKQVPQSWKKWRVDLLEAVGIVKDPERLKEWQSRKTDLEVRIEAEKERRKASRQMNASW